MRVILNIMLPLVLGHKRGELKLSYYDRAVPDAAKVAMMARFDAKWREGVREYILSLTYERRKDFEYQLRRQISLHERDIRDLREELREEVAALAFLERNLYVLPFKRQDDVKGRQEVAASEEKVAKSKEKVG